MAKRKQTTPEVLPSKPWKLSDIKEHPDNPRTHPPEQIELLADIFRKFGPDQDIVVDEDGLILKGHGRKLAAIQAEMATFPVTQRLGLSDHDKHALRVSDNALADLSGWNVDLLKPTLIDMQAAGYDMELLGFEPDALAGYLKTETAKDIEKTPAPSKKPIVRPGELWELGDHRIICGDSTDPKVWARLYGGSRAAMTFTDPPYGVSYEAKSGDFAVIEGDHKRRDDLYRMLVGAFKCMAKFTSTEGAFYIWHASSTRVDFSQAMAAAALVERQYLIWAKPSIVLGYSDYRWAHEPCQPAGTMVERVTGERKGRGRPSTAEVVPIETLRDGDRVTSYSAYSGKIIRRGRRIAKIGSRHYEGNMHTVDVGGKRTRGTADHRFTVRLDPAASEKHIVYLMKRGGWWRVGTVRLYNSRGFGLGVRLHDERADAAWIVSVHDDHLSARVAEQATCCLYGIPTTHWETSKRPNIATIRSQEQIAQIYAQVGVEFIAAGAARLLQANGLALSDPFVCRDEPESTSRRNTKLVRARNIVAGIMQVPVPTEGEQFEWSTITATSHAWFEGLVYSMDVEVDQHYVADGIVTHNCFYASHQERKPKFYGEPNETTVWRVAIAQPESTAVVLGPGLVLLDGHGHTLYLLPKTPKAKKAREVRLTGERPAIHVTDETGGGTVWEVAREHEYKHPTQKPVELARRAIVNSSQRGEIVADGFIGSGTTIMAAEATGRRCFAIDLDPAYVEVCIERWQEFTGKAAMLDGVPFETVAKARRKKERTNETSNPGKSVRSGKGSARPDRTMAKSPVREEMPPA